MIESGISVVMKMQMIGALEQNYEKATEWYKKAAERGHADAQEKID